jgi:hypothetical protein
MVEENRPGLAEPAMPSRPVILAIIAFWLATTTWLIYREVLPTLQSREPPPYTIDLADEVSAQSISWSVKQRDTSKQVKKEKDPVIIGMVQTQVKRNKADHHFILSAEFRPRNTNVLGVTQLKSEYTVTRAGDLRELEIRLESFKIGDQTSELVIKGKVEKGWFTPSIPNPGGLLLPPLQPVAVAGHGNVLNPLHPLNRLKGLRAGQQWVQPLFDPLAIAVSSVAVPGLGPPPLRQLHAEVMLGVLDWNDIREVPCWKIEYRDGDDRVVARTWVRREDGLVLQQDASHAGRMLILERIPAR